MMALTKAQREAIEERFKSLSADEQDAVLELAKAKLPKPDTVTVADLLKSIETLQGEVATLKKGKPTDEPTFLDRLLGRA